MSYRILIVDDSDLTRALLRDILVELGHEIVGEAQSMASTVEAYQNHRPDVVLLDLVLGNEDGIAVFKELRRIDPWAKIIIVSGVQQKEILRDLNALNPVARLSKPFGIK